MSLSPTMASPHVITEKSPQPIDDTTEKKNKDQSVHETKQTNLPNLPSMDDDNDDGETLPTFITRFKLNDRSIMRVLKKNSDYRGFDVVRLLKALAIRNRDYKPSHVKTWNLKYRVENGQIKECTITNKDSLESDMQFLLTNFVTKAVATRKADLQLPMVTEILGELKTKYMIRNTLAAYGSSLEARDVTLGRIAACFPFYVTDLYAHGLIASLVSFHDLGFAYDSEVATTVSKAILCPLMPALIPRRLAKCSRFNIIPFLLVVAIKIDNVINLEGVTGIGRIWDFFKSSYNANILTEKQKMEKMAQYGMLNENQDGFATPLVETRDDMKKMISQLRKGDKDLESVLQEIF